MSILGMPGFFWLRHSTSMISTWRSYGQSPWAAHVRQLWRTFAWQAPTFGGPEGICPGSPKGGGAGPAGGMAMDPHFLGGRALLGIIELMLSWQLILSRLISLCFQGPTSQWYPIYPCSSRFLWEAQDVGNAQGLFHWWWQVSLRREGVPSLESLQPGGGKFPQVKHRWLNPQTMPCVVVNRWKPSILWDWTHWTRKCRGAENKYPIKVCLLVFIQF